MNSYENNIIDAIELITDKKINNLNFNKTVQATVIKVIDKALGKYYVKYQDSFFDAYSVNLNTEYKEGSLVYIMIPSNDMTQNKMIIGSIDKTPLSQEIQTISKKDRYEEYGINCAGSLSIFELCSYIDGDIKILYDKNNNINLIGLNERDTIEYLREQKIIQLGAEFKTSIPAEQQIKGNYGIVFELIFKDSLERLITKKYTIDVNYMEGNPYKLKEFTLQNEFFSIQDEFQYVNRIYIFEKDFPNIEKEKLNDIFIKNIIIQGMIRLSDEDLNSSKIILSTPNGNYFKLEDDDNEKKEIIAKIKIDGKQTELNNIKYYWFKENDNIISTSENFSIQGGNGWELIAETSINQYQITKKDITSKEQRFKCVVNINDIKLYQTITMRNYSADYDISISSNLGTIFMYELSQPILTCLVNGIKDDRFEYSWSKQDENGYEKLSSLTNEYKPELNKIIGSAIYKCTVTYENKYIGTAALTLYNQIDNGNGFSIRILNGDKAYSYNTDGLSPTNQSLDNPIKIEPLRCVLYDNYGNAIDDSILSLCNIEWLYPTENTLLKIIKEDNNLLYYTIEDKYNKEYNNTENIKVKLSFKDMILTTKTAIIFNKQGDNGTNGSNIVCKVVPKTNEYVKYPLIKNGELNYKTNNGEWFDIKVYENGSEVLFNDFTVEWDIFKNKYDIDIEDYSDIRIDPDQKFSAGSMIDTVAANIVKATIIYKNKTYYASLPIISSQCAIGYDILFDGGFTQVQYGSNQKNPKYSDKPFEILLFKNGLNISLNENIRYEWNVLGQIYNNATKTWEHFSGFYENNSITNLTKNKKSFIPNDVFNGECVNCTLEVNVFEGVNTKVGTIRIPIYMFLNRYDNASINGWDGNSIKINKDGGYILAPQVGTGKKEKDNSFTGMIMGEAKEAGESDSKIGLLGYSKGEQSLFLDAESGGAIFGKTTGGKLSIDPSAEHAYLYSSNYWQDYNYKGFPKNYNDSNKKKEGMLIDLDLPEINFGNGNFTIDKDGNVNYKGSLNSRGVYTKSKINVTGYGWAQGSVCYTYRTPGIVTYFPCITNIEEDMDVYTYKINRIDYMNAGFGVFISNPINMDIEKIILNFDYWNKYTKIPSGEMWRTPAPNIMFDLTGVEKVGYKIPSWMDSDTHLITPKENINLGIYFIPVENNNAYYTYGIWSDQATMTTDDWQWHAIGEYPNGQKEWFNCKEAEKFLIKKLSLSPSSDKKNKKIDLTNELKNKNGILYFAFYEDIFSGFDVKNQSIVTVGPYGDSYYKSSSINVLEKISDALRYNILIDGDLEVEGYINFNG